MHKHKDSKRYNRPIEVKEGTKLTGRYADVMNRFLHFDTRRMRSHFYACARRLNKVSRMDPFFRLRGLFCCLSDFLLIKRKTASVTV